MAVHRPIPNRIKESTLIVGRRGKPTKVANRFYSPRHSPLQTGNMFFIRAEPGKKFGLYAKSHEGQFERKGDFDLKSQVWKPLGSCVSLLAYPKELRKEGELDGVLAHISTPKLETSLSSEARRSLGIAGPVDFAVQEIENALGRNTKLRFVAIPGNPNEKATAEIMQYLREYAKKNNVELLEPVNEGNLIGRHVYYFKPANRNLFGVRVEDMGP